jgi:ketosteroid isomerase-like protein
LTGCTTTPPPSADNSPGAAETLEIEQRLAEIFDAATTKDFDRLDRYDLYGPRFTKFGGEAFGRQDAVTAREGEHAGLAPLAELSMRADDLKVDLFNDTAVATFILHYGFRTDAGPVNAQARATLVFVKTADGWKIAHEHLSTPNR